MSVTTSLIFYWPLSVPHTLTSMRLSVVIVESNNRSNNPPVYSIRVGIMVPFNRWSNWDSQQCKEDILMALVITSRGLSDPREGRVENTKDTCVFHDLGCLPVSAWYVFVSNVIRFTLLSLATFNSLSLLPLSRCSALNFAVKLFYFLSNPCSSKLQCL